MIYEKKGIFSTLLDAIGNIGRGVSGANTGGSNAGAFGKPAYATVPVSRPKKKCNCSGKRR